MVRIATPEDAPAMAEIYNHYIRQSICTFEEKDIDAREMEKRREAPSTLCWLVYADNNKILGYAYAGAWKGRSGYRYTAETSVYIDAEHQGKGIGSILYSEILSFLKARSYHVAIGGIALPNDPSIKLHERMGFQKVAHFKETGLKFGRWIDVAYYQCYL